MILEVSYVNRRATTNPCVRQFLTAFCLKLLGQFTKDLVIVRVRLKLEVFWSSRFAEK